MTSWADFARLAPDLSAFGDARFRGGVSYLGKLRADGGPRVHPVTPIIGKQLFLFMEPTSPKGKDLLRDPRYTLHCAVENMEGGGGEFYVRGRTTLIDDIDTREAAALAAPNTIRPPYILFALSVEYAFMNTYDERNPRPRRWQSAG